MANSSTNVSFIEFIPVSIFGSVMGMCGLSFAWHRAAALWGLSKVPAEAIGLLAIASFVILLICYILKWIKFRELVTSEFQSPATVSFFATFIICLLLLPGLLLEMLPAVATGMWILGAALMLLFAWYMLRSWLDKPQEPSSAMPYWVLPIVGTLDMPIVGDQLPIPGIHEFTLFAFGIGTLFAMILLVIIISRLIFQPSLPEAVQPGLMILLGPLALAFTVYIELSGRIDIMAGTLFYFNLFLGLILGSKVLLIPRSCPFKITWWAVSFPLSALTISTLIYAHLKSDLIHRLLAAGSLIIATIIIAYLFLTSVNRIINKTF